LLTADTLVLTFIKIQNCLDEYAVDGTSIVGLKFEGTKYEGLYQGMLDLIDEIKSDEYHGRKWRENCKRWAKKGWYVLLASIILTLLIPCTPTASD